MGVNIKKEISIGQITTAVMFVLGAVGAAYAIETRVSDLEEHVKNKVDKSELVYVNDNIHNMASDIRDIRNLMYDKLGKQANSSPTPARRDSGTISSARQP